MIDLFLFDRGVFFFGNILIEVFKNELNPKQRTKPESKTKIQTKPKIEIPFIKFNLFRFNRETNSIRNENLRFTHTHKFYL